MKPSHHVSQLPDPKTRSCLCSLFISASLICGVYFTASALFAKDYRIPPEFGIIGTQLTTLSDDPQVSPKLEIEVDYTRECAKSNKFKGKCRPLGSEALPEGIVVKTSNLETRPLWGPLTKNIRNNRAQPFSEIALEATFTLLCALLLITLMRWRIICSFFAKFYYLLHHIFITFKPL